MDELEHAGKIIAGGNLEEARSFIRREVERRLNLEGKHLEWGKLCEEAGFFGLAMREYQLALRDDGRNREALFLLSEVYRERGDGSKAVSLLEKLFFLEPGNEEVFLILAESYSRQGLDQKLKFLVEKARAAGVKEALISSVGHRLEGEAGESTDKGSKRPESVPYPSDADLFRFIHLFSGREDVYARQWWDERGGGGYTPVRQPFTPQVARNHILGNVTIGVYPIRLDDTVAFFAIDLDINKRALERAWGDAREVRRLRDLVRTEGLRILGRLGETGMEPLYEDSGYKGRHYWFFLEQPEEAVVIDKLGKMLLNAVGPVEPGLHLEFFPKQGKRRGKGLGNLIKLPLGVHRKSGRRSLLLDAEGKPADKPFEMLSSVKRIPRKRLYSLVSELKASCLAPEEAPPWLGESERLESMRMEGEKIDLLPPPPERPPSWTEADFELDPEVSRLLSSCPVLRALRKRADEHRKLSHDERIVLIHSMGHLHAGPPAVNYLLEKCVNIGPRAFMKSRLRGSPISCLKIRKRVPAITSRVDCNCAFEFAEGQYPTPLLHLRGLDRKEKRKGKKETKKSTEEIALLYAHLLRKTEELEEEVREARSALLARLERTETGEIACPGGRFVLRKEKDTLPYIEWVPDRVMKAGKEGT